MVNKENGNKRPCYFCFRDRKNKDIIWFVPISTKYENYKKLLKKFELYVIIKYRIGDIDEWSEY